MSARFGDRWGQFLAARIDGENDARAVEAYARAVLSEVYFLVELDKFARALTFTGDRRRAEIRRVLTETPLHIFTSDHSASLVACARLALSWGIAPNLVVDTRYNAWSRPGDPNNPYHRPWPQPGSLRDSADIGAVEEITAGILVAFRELVGIFPPVIQAGNENGYTRGGGDATPPDWYAGFVTALARAKQAIGAPSTLLAGMTAFQSGEPDLAKDRPWQAQNRGIPVGWHAFIVAHKPESIEAWQQRVTTRHDFLAAQNPGRPVWCDELSATGARVNGRYPWSTWEVAGAEAHGVLLEECIRRKIPATWVLVGASPRDTLHPPFALMRHDGTISPAGRELQRIIQANGGPVRLVDPVPLPPGPLPPPPPTPEPPMPEIKPADYLRALSRLAVKTDRGLAAATGSNRAAQLRKDKAWRADALDLLRVLSGAKPPSPPPEPPPEPQPGPGDLLGELAVAQAKGRPFALRWEPSRGQWTVDWRVGNAGHHGRDFFDRAIEALRAYSEGRLRSKEGGVS